MFVVTITATTTQVETQATAQISGAIFVIVEREKRMPRQLLVQGAKNFKIVIPDDAKVTFGPWSPPKMGKVNPYDGGLHTAGGQHGGTLRIYVGNEKNIIGCFSGVTGFRDLSMEYAEEVAREEGDTIWKSDEHGYMRESKMKSTREWVEPAKQLPAKSGKKKRGK